MPPKKQEKVKKDAAKAVDDKTFGMKNKNKSTKVQKFVAQVQKQAQDAGKDKRRQDDVAKAKADKKKLDELKKAEMDELFKQVQPVQKVPFGVDPKTVVCIAFKKGSCTRGAKCKFSHDMNIERKAEKKNLYEDVRSKDEDMTNWDDEKLRQVVTSKHGNPKTTTDIVCKFFLEAVEEGKYGWKWVCPNGGDDCKYRHALPPGFVLKTKEQRALEREAAKNAPKLTIEDFIEVERHKLQLPLTPVTLASFETWKQSRVEMKTKLEEEQRKQRETQVKAGKGTGISGRELFEFDPSLLIDSDDEDADELDLTQFHRDLDAIQNEANEANGEELYDKIDDAR